MAKHVVTETMPHDSVGTLVCGYQNFSWNFNAIVLTRCTKCKWCG